MAQAARLSLRMQKELKLLLSDPPPGASFPSLSSASDASSSSSLTAIDAEINGPEDTVYSGGVFKIRIEIPERYPFQPPIVTFSTPIYHPNIDNGGRICLDILNLPPKGAWQPSLNISTLITSIGLLLSEPNPDDGLMCEASREFKYNKQAFDLKARTMTEKYAKASSGMVSSSQGPQQTVENRLTGDIEVGHEIKIKDSKCIINSSKPVRKKLSLDPLVSHCMKNDNGKENEVSDPVLSNLDSKRKGEPGESNPKLKGTDEVHKMGASYFPKRQKLSLKLPVQPEQSECDRKNCLVDQQVPSHSNPSNIQTVNGSNLPSSLVSNSNQQGPDMDPAAQGRVSIKHENSKKYSGSKKLSLGFSVMSRNHENCENENLMPVRNSTVEPNEDSKENLSSNSVKPELTKQAGIGEGSGDNEPNKNKKKGFRSFSDTETCSMPHQRRCTEECQTSKDRSDAAQDMQQSDSSLAVIVLDSDESDQEEDRSRCRRSKLSLLSKRPF